MLRYGLRNISKFKLFWVTLHLWVRKWSLSATPFVIKENLYKISNWTLEICSWFFYVIQILHNILGPSNMAHFIWYFWSFVFYDSICSVFVLHAKEAPHPVSAWMPTWSISPQWCERIYFLKCLLRAPPRQTCKLSNQTVGGEQSF